MTGMLTLALLLVSPSAEAAPPVEYNAKNRLGTSFGLGSAVGYFGFSFERDALPWLQIEGGIGLGYTGVQLEGAPRLVLPLASWFGLFVAGGPSLSIRSTQPRRVRLWGNLEFGFQIQGKRFFVRAGGGYTVLMRGRVKAPCLHCQEYSYWEEGERLPALRNTYGVRF
jgi:hypothetical protein